MVNACEYHLCFPSQGSTDLNNIFITQVFAEKFNHQYKPIRDSTHRNYVSVDDYPHTHFPSYATGNFYMLSIDLIEYIVDNQDSLSPVGTLEDVSVAYWLSKIAVSCCDQSGWRRVSV